MPGLTSSRIASQGREAPPHSPVRRDIVATCRFLFASTVPLSDLVANGRLLPDLCHRMQWHIIEVPGLEERLEDILPFASDVLRRTVKEFGLPPLALGPCAISLLTSRSWPGHLRELTAAVERAAVVAAADGSPEVLTRHFGKDSRTRPVERPSTREVRRQRVEWALRETNGHRGKAAALLGVHRNTVSRLAG